MLQTAMKKPSFWVGTALFLIVWINILHTNANTVSYWDCAENATCAYSMGVPHPPGSPLLVLVGHIAMMLYPAGEWAARACELTTLLSAVSLLLTFLIIVRLVRKFRGPEETTSDHVVVLGGAMIGTLALAFSPSFWFNSVEFGVWAISFFLTVFVIWLGLKWADESIDGSKDHLLLLLTYMNGFGLACHQLNLLTLPALFFIIWFKDKRLAYYLIGGTLFSYFLMDVPLHMGIPFSLKIASWPIMLGFYLYLTQKGKHEAALIPMAHVLAFLGFSLYILIFIRANLHPIINENDPSTLAHLRSYLSREQYGTENMVAGMFSRKAPFWEYQVKKMYLRYFDWNFIGSYKDLYYNDKLSGWRYFGLPFFLGLFGVVHHFAKDKKQWFVNFVLFFCTGLAIILYVNQDDPQPRERDYSYTGSFFAFALWIGIGAVAVIDSIAEFLKKKQLSTSVATAIIVVLALIVPGRMYQVNHFGQNRKNNYVAYDYSRNILESCAPNAVLFTNGDNDTFPLWYLQVVEKVRPDVTVANLSLINTGWYIKQLRDVFKAPISFDDDFIDRYIDATTEEAIMTRYWPPDRRKMTIRSPEGPMSWDVPAAFYIPTDQNQTDRSPNFLRVQDMMIVDILRSNVRPDGSWKRPIYFAATVANSAMAGLSNYGVMEGLAFRIYPHPHANRIDPEKMYETLIVKFKGYYRHLDDPNVYYNENESRLLQNYRSCFLQLAFYYYQNIVDPTEKFKSSGIPPSQWESRFHDLTTREKTLFLLDQMEQVMPSSVIPFDMPELVMQIGKIYNDLGRPDELRKRLEILSKNSDEETEDNQILLAGSYEQYLGKSADAQKIYNKLMGANPSAEDLFRAGEVLFRSGLDSAAAKKLSQAAMKGTLPPDKQVKTASYLMQMNKFSEAEFILTPMQRANPEDGQVLGALVALYERTNRSDRVVSILGDWVTKHPNDNGAKERLEAAKKSMTKHG